MAWAEFTDEGYQFFLDEFGLDRAAIDSLKTEDEQYELYEKCIEIEIEETIAGDPISKRGEMAADLADMIYNPGATPEGIAEYEAEMASLDAGEAEEMKTAV